MSTSKIDHRPPLPRKRKVDTRPPIERKKLTRESSALSSQEFDHYFLNTKDQQVSEVKANSTAIRVVTHAIGSKYAAEIRDETDEKKKEELQTRLGQVKELAKKANQKMSPRLRSDLRAGMPKALAFAKDQSRRRAQMHREKTRSSLSGTELRKKWEREMEEKKTKIEIGDVALNGVEEDKDNELITEKVTAGIGWQDRDKLRAGYSKKEKEDITGESKVFARSWGTPAWLKRRQEKNKLRLKEKRRQKRQQASGSVASYPVSNGDDDVLLSVEGWKTKRQHSIEFIVDSGASATVITPDTADHLPLHPLPEKKKYTSASKNSLPCQPIPP